MRSIRPAAMRTFPFAVVLVCAAAGGALAADADDPGALLRRARAAETVDRDVAAALALYRQVFDAAPGTDAGRDAGLRLLELLEVRGDRSAGVEVARVLTEAYGARLADDAKRLVHEAMARMLPAGSRMRSPLGELYVVPPFGAAASSSPLDAKVAALLPRVDAPNSPTRLAVLQELALIGADALVPLERILRSERYDHATFAAEGLAQLGTPAAVDALARGVREGDGFTRAAALEGLRRVPGSEPVSAHLVRVVDGLRAEPALAASARRLTETLARHAQADDLVRRVVSTATGSAEASAEARAVFAAAAIHRGGDAAASVVRWYAGRDEAVPAEVARALERFSVRNSIGGSSTRVVYRLVYAAEPAVRLDALRLLLRGPPGANTQRAVEVAVACVHAGEPGVAEEAARLGWHLATDPSLEGTPGLDLADLANLTRTLLEGGVPVPREVADDERRVGPLLDRWDGSHSEPVLAGLVSAPMLPSPTFHVALARAVRRRPDLPAWNALLSRIDVGSVPASAVDAWEEALAATINPKSNPPPRFFALQVVFRAGRPSALDRIRLGLEAGWARSDWVLSALLKPAPPATRARLLIEVVAAWPDSGDVRGVPVLGAAFASALREPAFYETLASMSRTDPTTAQRMTARLGERRFYTYDLAWCPTALAPQWLAWLETGATARDDDPTGWLPVAGWAATGDPAGLVAWLDRRLASRPEGAPEASLSAPEVAAVVAVCETATGPEARRARRALSQRKGLPEGLQRSVVEGLARPAPDGDRERLVELAGVPGDAGAEALRHLVDLGQAQDVAPIVSALAGRTTPEGPWREALLGAALHFRLRAALPWLRAELEAGPPHRLGEVAAAIDLIVSHHDRVARLKALGDGSRDPAAEAEVMLDDDDPDLRAAAIVSFAALKGRDALPRLLRMAKTEPDPARRRVLLDTIERVGRAALAPAPVPPEGPEVGAPEPRPAAK